MIYRDGGKRLFDVLVSVFLLLFFAVPLLFAMLAVKLSSPGPIFFCQARVGRYGQIFRLLKLRTMSVDPGRRVTAQVGRDSAGVFPVGRVLRRFKIDELPQVINVIRGEMSIVGPRPCLVETLDDMPRWAQGRFTVRPGITGLAQTEGNVNLSWEERWDRDIQYVDRISFSMDVQLLLKTVAVVMCGEDNFGRSA
jgi:undecaprenyl phosphate N,N'-diacetylbacillosamine 1-phosphate transferase